MRIVWAKETQDDFWRIGDFLKPLNPEAAKRAAKTIRKTASRLSEFPDIGSAVDDGTGRRQLFVPFGKHGFVLHYIVDYEADYIRILRIWHTRENRGGG